MDSYQHLIGFRGIVECLVLVRNPDESVLAVPLADVRTQLDKRLKHTIMHCIRLSGIGSALDRDGSVVVCG